MRVGWGQGDVGSPHAPAPWTGKAGLALAAVGGALAILLGPGADAAQAAPGQLFQLNGSLGCTAQVRAEGCATGRGLQGASSVAVSPDGRNVYLAANESSSLATFNRRPSSGRVVQPRELRGCVSETGGGGCRTGRGLHGAFAVAVSPDGRNVYVASLRGIAVFSRNPKGGGLQQLPGARGCLSQDAANGCAPARGLATASSVAVSPDGRSVYATGFGSGAIAVFSRAAGSGGDLSQLPGADGCISAGGTEGCAPGRGLSGAFSLAVSPSGGHVYASGFLSHAVSVLRRDPGTGRLDQLPGVDGCVSRGGSEGCTPASGLANPNGVATSPDGRSLYVASSGAHSVASFRVGPDGALHQPGGQAGCSSLNGAGACARAPGLRGAFAVAVSPDEDNVYVVSQRAVTTFQRRKTGSLKAADCISHRGVDDCTRGRALDGGSSVTLDPRGSNLYVAAYDSAAISVFARDPRRGRVRVRIPSVPRNCVRRAFRVRVLINTLLPLRNVRVFLNRQRVATTRRQRFTVRIRPARLPRGAHRLRVRAVDVAGTVSQRRARFRRC